MSKAYICVMSLLIRIIDCVIRIKVQYCALNILRLPIFIWKRGLWYGYFPMPTFISGPMFIMVSQVVENQTRVSKISILLACKSTYSEEICVYCTKRQRRDIKNRAFSEFKVNFQGLLSTKSSRKQFSLKNIKLEEQLLLKPFLVLVFYIKVYLVKMCLIFDGSSLAFGASYQSFLRVY